MIDERRAENAHEPGQTDQVNISRRKCLAERLIEGAARGEISVANDLSGDIRLFGARQASRIVFVRDNQADARRIVRLGAGIDQCLQIRAAAGYQNRKFQLRL